MFFMWHPRPRSSSLPSSQLPFSRHCRGLTLHAHHAHSAAISRSCRSTSRRTSRSPTIRRKPFTFSSSSIYFSDVTSQQPTARGKLTGAVPEARTALAAKISRPNCCPPNEIELYIDGIKVHGLVDTGAAVSVISEKLCRNLKKVTTQLTDLSLQTATSHHIQPSALCTARVVIQGAMYVVTFVVLFRSSHDVILGWDFLSSNSALVDCARSELALSVPCYDPDDGASCRVFAASDVDIAPFSAVVVSVSCASPPKSPVLFMPSVPSACRRNIMLPFAVVIFRNGHAAIYVCNPSDSPSSLLRGECLGSYEPYECILPATIPDSTVSLPICAVTPTNAPNDALDVFSDAIDSELAPTQREEIINLLLRFRSSFDRDQSGLSRTSAVVHRIDTGQQAPLRQRPYRVSSAERRVIDEQVDDMLKRGIIEPSNSPWASPVVLVKKKTDPSGSALTTADSTR